MEKIRVDKWLWTVRIFKSRSMATAACKANKVKIDEKPVKPSTLIKVGETINVRKNGFDLVFLVKGLLKSRVSATLAAECYQDLTPESELNKYKDWYIGKASAEKRAKGDGRPTKRDRRELEGYKEIQYFFDEDFDED